MVEHQPSKLGTSDRYRYPAQNKCGFGVTYNTLANQVKDGGVNPLIRSNLRDWYNDITLACQVKDDGLIPSSRSIIDKGSSYKKTDRWYKILPINF